MTAISKKDMQQYLCATEYFDYDDPQITSLFEQIKIGSPKAMAIEIYYLVRDNYLYNPYCFVDGINSFRGSYCCEKNEGYCIPKASLMIALCRKAGIPARLGLADVKNHLATPKLLEMLGTDIFSMHGYVEVCIEGKWVKATPAFNRSLCEKMHSLPLEFNGEDDSIFQPFTEKGHKHMEYITDWGTFAELPVDFIMDNFNKHYPHFMGKLSNKEYSADIAPAMEKE
ncbi:transglutaminase family protein [Aliiglaciecola sp. 3_MG-2023]|uniref:transglutaminase-like domain-containing protein n=1 Tax=Aliiglaciecola sp. 3_MG-2023 TaxID=3062644 RepID=UPI0026E2B3CF|nr:transglutaminase family protein [Aliiglaciecola sp. 3_MG-2023]MDO6694667.1 transglutaminase family protein [Aliiglaciecola sp. 3_MG-2023]